ncbi:NADP-dependent oxidoreductase [Pseudomonas saliphila]|uniref:NADP-dependent oxidoreductase n=1 Tax=Pseudomonas saliphila TaxID=2586906 RepID=UPI00123AC070|nr:NADP-dependent oxidoreductase [Pseudomonas saliphila]
MPATDVNRQWIYAQRPTGAVGLEHFRLQETSIPVPGPGQALVRLRGLSVDPAQRAWMMTRTYRPQLQPGEVMAAFGIGEVMESNVPDLAPGDLVDGDLGWQDFALVTPESVRVRNKNESLEHLIGVLGITGLTAYFGLLEVGRPRPGETVVVSGAAGAVGCIAVQIARIAGCRVVAVAGGAEKCRWLTEELGVDAAVDYKAGNLREALKAACPDGIDVYFDNTGGEILEVSLSLMNAHGRVACCGAVSQYNQADWGGGPSGVPGVLVAKRIRMEGFLVMDFYKQRKAAERTLSNWIRHGQLNPSMDIVEGLENAPKALIDLLHGTNRGKMMVRIGATR